MIEPSDDGDKWRLRERALFLGVLSWSFGLTILLAYYTNPVHQIFEMHPVAVGSLALLSIGVAAGVFHALSLLYWTYKGSQYDECLTEWDEI